MTKREFAELERCIPDLVKNAMLTAWNEICSDTSCHPLDMEQDFEGRKGHLGFVPRHWSQMVGNMVAHQIKNFVIATHKERAKQIGQFVMTGKLES